MKRQPSFCSRSRVLCQKYGHPGFGYGISQGKQRDNVVGYHLGDSVGFQRYFSIDNQTLDCRITWDCFLSTILPASQWLPCLSCLTSWLTCQWNSPGIWSWRLQLAFIGPAVEGGLEVHDHHDNHGPGQNYRGCQILDLDGGVVIWHWEIPLSVAYHACITPCCWLWSSLLATGVPEALVHLLTQALISS